MGRKKRRKRREIYQDGVVKSQSAVPVASSEESHVVVMFEGTVEEFRMIKRVLRNARITGSQVSHRDGTDLASNELSPQPSPFSQRVLSLLLKADEQDAATGDLIEKYRREYLERGERAANRWIYWQLAHSLASLSWRVISKLGWLIVGEWIKKHSS